MSAIGAEQRSAYSPVRRTGTTSWPNPTGCIIQTLQWHLSPQFEWIQHTTVAKYERKLSILPSLLLENFTHPGFCRGNLEGCLGWKISEEDMKKLSSLDFQLRLVDGIRFLRQDITAILILYGWLMSPVSEGETFHADGSKGKCSTHSQPET